MMTASWASRERSWKGFGWRAWGAVEARGGIDMRDAKGADVCGRSVASGSHGGGAGFSFFLLVSMMFMMRRVV